MIEKIKILLLGYSSILFIRSHLTGLLILSITMLRPNIGLSGLTAVAGAYLFSRIIDNGRSFPQYHVNIFNPMLTGCAVGYMFKLTPATLILTMVLGILAYITTVIMGNVLYTYFKLPVLTLPFVLLNGLFHLAAAQYSTLATLNHSGFPGFLNQSLPLWISGYLKALGAIFFMPHVFPGILLMICLLLVSRILLFLTLLGYFTGIAFSALLLGSLSTALTDINHLNSILIAAAIGGIFLIPSLKSYLIAMTAVGISTVLLHSLLSFWWFNKMPGVPFTFNLVVLAFVYTLGILKYPGLSIIPRRTPEESLDFFLLNRNRPLASYRTISLPFSGKWSVWQGFDGQWTHKGSWKYAYDFIITDHNQKSYRGSGEKLSDYYAFNKPVLSPVDGVVAAVQSHFNDNPINQPDTVSNWGNYIIIRDYRGFFVEISHFAHQSIKIKTGDVVQRGTFLGLCGNSGFSRQPHIHIQVQLSDLVGAYTVPFCFAGYSCNNQYHDGELPLEGTTVEPLYWNKTVELQTTPPLEEVFVYNVLKNNRPVDRLELKVKMALDGTRYFESARGKLYFGNRSGTMYFYGLEGDDPYLKYMLQALPRFPLSCRKDLQWITSLPAGMLYKGWRRAIFQLLSSFCYSFAGAKAILTCPQPNLITGTL